MQNLIELKCTMEKRQIVSLDRPNQRRAVQVFVAALARGFRDEHAGMAGSFVQCMIFPAVMLSAQRIGGTVLHCLQSAVDVPTKLLRPAQADKAPKRPFAIWCGGVEQYACHRAALAFGWQGIDTLADACCCVAALQGELAHQRVGK